MSRGERRKALWVALCSTRVGVALWEGEHSFNVRDVGGMMKEFATAIGEPCEDRMEAVKEARAWVDAHAGVAYVARLEEVFTSQRTVVQSRLAEDK